MNPIDRIPADKRGHLIGGALIAAVAMALAILLGDVHIAGYSGLLAAAVSGVCKEVGDFLANRKAKAAGLLPPHSVEPMDAVWTAGGGVLMFLPWAAFFLRL